MWDVCWETNTCSGAIPVGAGKERGLVGGGCGGNQAAAQAGLRLDCMKSSGLGYPCSFQEGIGPLYH